MDTVPTSYPVAQPSVYWWKSGKGILCLISQPVLSYVLLTWFGWLGFLAAFMYGGGLNWGGQADRPYILLVPYVIWILFGFIGSMIMNNFWKESLKITSSRFVWYMASLQIVLTPLMVFLTGYFIPWTAYVTH